MRQTPNTNPRTTPFPTPSPRLIRQRTRHKHILPHRRTTPRQTLHLGHIRRARHHIAHIDKHILPLLLCRPRRPLALHNNARVDCIQRLVLRRHAALLLGKRRPRRRSERGVEGVVCALRVQVRPRHFLRLGRGCHPAPVAAHGHVHVYEAEAYWHEVLAGPGGAVEVAQVLSGVERVRAAKRLLRGLWRAASREGEAVLFDFRGVAEIWFRARGVGVAFIHDLVVVCGQGSEFGDAGHGGGLLLHFDGSAEVYTRGRAHEARSGGGDAACGGEVARRAEDAWSGEVFGGDEGLLGG